MIHGSCRLLKFPATQKATLYRRIRSTTSAVVRDIKITEDGGVAVLSYYIGAAHSSLHNEPLPLSHPSSRKSYLSFVLRSEVLNDLKSGQAFYYRPLFAFSRRMSYTEKKCNSRTYRLTSHDSLRSYPISYLWCTYCPSILMVPSSTLSLLSLLQNNCLS